MPQQMPYGLAFTINQQGIALAQADERVGELERENAELRAKLADRPDGEG